MIVFDLQALQSAAHAERGIGRYVFDLATTLHGRHPGLVDRFAWNDALPYAPVIDRLELGERLTSFSALAGVEIDVLHVNSPFEALDAAEFTVPVAAERLVVTCYDLIPYRFADRYLADPSVSARYRSRLGLLAAADAVVTDSQSCADDLVELLDLDPRRLTVIGAGVAAHFVPAEVPEHELLGEMRESFPTLEAGFVLAPSGTDWRKNAVGVIAAYGQLAPHLRRRHQLVISCAVDPGARAWLEGEATAAGVADRMLLTGHVSDSTLVALYQACELVVFPSFYEGFGLPVLEARRCGARVICSWGSSLPEVLPDPIAWFDPWDPGAIADRMSQALDDPAFAAALGAIPDPGLAWPATASKVAGVYRHLQRAVDAGRARSA